MEQGEFLCSVAHESAHAPGVCTLGASVVKDGESATRARIDRVTFRGDEVGALLLSCCSFHPSERMVPQLRRLASMLFVVLNLPLC